MRERTHKAVVEEALTFPLEKYQKRDGSINITKLKKHIHPDFYQDALNAIFVKKALKIHGDFFGYERLNFVTLKQLVEIWCPDHEDYFWQTAKSHLDGHGCAVCAKKVVTRVNEYGTFTLPASIHQFRLEDNHIIWFSKTREIKFEREV